MKCTFYTLVCLNYSMTSYRFWISGLNFRLIDWLNFCHWLLQVVFV